MVAAPHVRLGEGVAAFVVAAEGKCVPDAATLGAFLSQAGLAPQKWPEFVFAVEALPRTASGKVQKHLLRAEAKSRLAPTAS